jgi:hypothetical protein
VVGQERHIDEAGRHYHLKCWLTLPPTRVAVLASIADYASDLIADALITDAVISAVSAKFKDQIAKYGITIDEIRSAIKERIRR